MGHTSRGSSFELFVSTLTLCCALAACRSDKPPETAVKPRAPVVQTNLVTFKVTPAKATIKVNGKITTAGKVRLLPSNAGHEIRVEAKGYKPYKTCISAQTNVVLRVTLERLLPRKGVLGLLKASRGSDAQLASIFGRDSALGTDAIDALSGARGPGGFGLVGSARVRGSTLVVNGPLAKTVVSRQLNKRLTAVRACFKKVLEAQPKLQGEVVLRFIIDERGTARSAQVRKNTLKKPAVNGCLLAAVSKGSYSRPRGRRKALVAWTVMVVARAPNLGALGTIGRGGSTRRTRSPRTILGRLSVRGSLDRGIIRRILRRHINEAKYCYQKELSANPGLYGRVTVRFIINYQGQVTSAKLLSTTMKNKPVESCLVKAVKRWLFPRSRGGIVMVDVPFVFRAIK